MKVIYISTSVIPSLTANSIHVMKMCQAMVQEGHQPTLYAHRPAKTADQKSDNLWNHYGISERFAIRWLLPNQGHFAHYLTSIQAVWLAWRSHADLIYTRNVTAAAISSNLGLPTIYEIHDMPSGKLGPWLFTLFLRGRGLVRLVAITDALRQDVLARYGYWLDGKDFIVAPDGVDLERFVDLPSPEEARYRLGLAALFTAGYAGSHYAGRGIELIFELARLLPGVQFLIMGGDEQSVDARRKQAVQQGLVNMYFVGFVSNADLPLYLSACEVLLMPYQRQVAVSSGGNTVKYMSPLKLFEYMAMHRLVISSDLPVLREVLNERNAILCDPEDIGMWQNAIKICMADVELRQRLGSQAWQDVQQYSWRKRVQRCLAEYHS